MNIIAQIQDGQMLGIDSYHTYDMVLLSIEDRIAFEKDLSDYIDKCLTDRPIVVKEVVSLQLQTGKFDIRESFSFHQTFLIDTKAFEKALRSMNLPDYLYVYFGYLIHCPHPTEKDKQKIPFLLLCAELLHGKAKYLFDVGIIKEIKFKS